MQHQAHRGYFKRLTCVPWVNRCTGLPLQDDESRATHGLDYHSHGPDPLLDLKDYENMAKRQALSLVVLGVGMIDGRNEAVRSGKAGFDMTWSYTSAAV